MEKAVLRLTFLLVLIATASCLGHGTEAKEMTNQAKQDVGSIDSIPCSFSDDCAKKCPCNVGRCVDGFCQCESCPTTVQN
ncbi:hypothetical protein AB3S75_015067 [Citrus x aurantiifolia]